MALRLPRISINRTWLMLVVAVVLALLATLLTTQYLKNREQSMAAQLAAQASQGGPKIAVVVPVRDLPVGTPLDPSLVAARNVAVDLVYPEAIKADDFDKVKGQSLIRAVYKGRPLLSTDLRPLYADFAGSLAPGTRAMTIDIDELNSISHMLQPGNLIDLMLVMKRDDGGQTVVPFMDKMKVLATGQKLIQDTGEDKAQPAASRRTASYTTVTLEVTPVQAARLTLAMDIGKMRAVLRNQSDNKSEDYSVNAQNILDEVTEHTRNIKSPLRRSLAGGSVEYIIGGNRSGPTAKAVDVPTNITSVPPLIPNPALYGPRAGTGAQPPTTAPPPAMSPPASSGSSDSGYSQDQTASNGLSSDQKSALRDLLNNSK
jgi:pilus assembly protein CpaB